MICEITGMGVSNASMYDGATAMAEAAIMGCGATGRKEILISKTVHPHYRRLLYTYALDFGFVVRELDYVDGVTCLAKATEAITKETPKKTEKLIKKMPVKKTSKPESAPSDEERLKQLESKLQDLLKE